jgi:hypothetical protein
MDVDTTLVLLAMNTSLDDFEGGGRVTFSANAYDEGKYTIKLEVIQRINDQSSKH